MPVADWFSGLATIGGFLYFLTGFAAAYATACVRAKVRGRRVQIPWRISGIVVGIAAMIIVTLQAQVAYTTAKETAQEVQDCQREFNAALKARARITSENDEVSQSQRRIVFNWIHRLILPPPPYASMSTNDQRRQDYGYTITIQTEKEFQASLDRQDELQRQRDRSPLPSDPTCGKQ
jgi:hypothetical protein